MKGTHILIFLLLTTTQVMAQQWEGQNNKDSAIIRKGGFTIGLDTFRYKGPNVIHLAKHTVIRMKENGDLFDVINEQQNLPDGADVIWGAVSNYQSSNAGLLTLSSPTSPTSGYVRRFTVRANGNVGIGVQMPKSKLEVNGTIHTKEIIIDSSGWADYVFNKEYNLMPLKKLNSFIKKNKHLPNMPSATSIIKEGINVGDITVKLLSKIEELTLYILQQNKEMEIQQKQIKTLQSKVGK